MTLWLKCPSIAKDGWRKSHSRKVVELDPPTCLLTPDIEVSCPSEGYGGGGSGPTGRVQLPWVPPRHLGFQLRLSNRMLPAVFLTQRERRKGRRNWASSVQVLRLGSCPNPHWFQRPRATRRRHWALIDPASADECQSLLNLAVRSAAGRGLRGEPGGRGPEALGSVGVRCRPHCPGQTAAKPSAFRRQTGRSWQAVPWIGAGRAQDCGLPLD